MRWVDVNEQLPIPQRRVLVAMHAGTEWESCWDILLGPLDRRWGNPPHPDE